MAKKFASRKGSVPPPRNEVGTGVPSRVLLFREPVLAPPLDRDLATRIVRSVAGSLAKRVTESIFPGATFAQLGITPSALADELEKNDALRDNAGVDIVRRLQTNDDLVTVITILLDE